MSEHAPELHAVTLGAVGNELELALCGDNDIVTITVGPGGAAHSIADLRRALDYLAASQGRPDA